MASQASISGRALDADTILDLLANRRRRYLLYALHGRSESIELARVAERVASWELDRPREAVSKKEYKSVYVSSVQCHVPKLAEHDVVSHDKTNHSVILDKNFKALEPYLEVIIDDEPRDSLVAEEIQPDRTGLVSQIRHNMRRLTP